MGKFITITFWISNEPFLRSTLIAIAVLFGVTFAIGLFLRSKASKKKGDPMNDVYKKVSVAAFTMAVLGFFLLWFSMEGVAYLGMRFNYLVWLAIVIVWVIPLYKRYKKIPVQVREKKLREEFDQYLPKKKE